MSNYNAENYTVTKSKSKSSKKTNTTTSYYGSFGSLSQRVQYDGKGTKNETQFPEFINICKYTQEELKETLPVLLVQAGYDVQIGDGYIYAKGDVPVLLTAHMDTVHKEPIKDFYEYYEEEKNRHILSSPQGIGGDDRCGIYMILEIIKSHKCSVIFCEDEEIGGVGSKKFCNNAELVAELSGLNYMIELDRANDKDAVFYSCDSEKFTKFIEDNTGYKEAHGSFSDISNLAPAAGVAAVNLSCGYYNAHTTSEYVVVEEMLNTIEVVKKLLDVECEQFEYVKKKYSDYYGGYYSGYYSGRYYDGYGYGNSYNQYRSFLFQVYKDDKLQEYIANGKTLTEAVGRFLMDNPTMTYNDIYDYEDYGMYVGVGGWV